MPRNRRAPPKPASSVPAARPASNVAQPAKGAQQPGLFGQMASTAAGVAIGSTVGHAVSGALFGGHRGDRSDDLALPGQHQQNTCQFELQQFVECAQTQHDIRMCQDLNEALLQCNKETGPS